MTIDQRVENENGFCVQTDIDDNYVKFVLPVPEFKLLTGSTITRLTLDDVKELHERLGRVIERMGD